MKTLSVLILTLVSLHISAQENPTQQASPIVAEGKRLYQSEMASWYGTDLFVENYKDQKNIGGYFSYEENGISKCIFFSRDEHPKVIGTISFDSSFDTKKAKTEIVQREFTPGENDLYTIRKITLELLNSDTMFKTYKNTNFNLIPLISGDERKVYVLTGPQQNGVVIFGNDYLISFDNNNNIISKKQLHKNIIPVNYGEKVEDGKVVLGTMHSHLPETGDFITATDICTLMLYAKFAGWKQHNVVSKKYLNIWNCETNGLVVVPMGAMERN